MELENYIHSVRLMTKAKKYNFNILAAA